MKIYGAQQYSPSEISEISPIKQPSVFIDPKIEVGHKSTEFISRQRQIIREYKKVLKSPRFRASKSVENLYNT